MARSAEVTDVEKQVPAREDVSEIRSLPETISTSYRARITRTFTSNKWKSSAPVLEKSNVTNLRLRLDAVEKLFGLQEEDVSEWPGVLVFFQNLEAHFHELLDSRFNIIWSILGKGPPTSAADGWRWCFAVLDAFTALRAGESDPSIERAFQQVLRSSSITPHGVGEQDKRRGLVAMFAALCWTTASLDPVVEEGAADSPLHLLAENSGRRYTARDTRRPLSKMFYSFREAGTLPAMQGTEWQSQPDSEYQPGPARRLAGDEEDALFESSLNYFTLHTIGRIKLKWVDTLTAHLAFDRSTRTLSLFRYPSFCVANVLRKNDVVVLRSIVSKLLSSHYHHDSLCQEHAAVYREVLLSYRLLFGQSSKSRRLVAQLLDGHATRDNATAASQLDPFLRVICTSPLKSFWRSDKTISALPSNLFPASVLGIDDQLQEVPTYSVRDDFPILGPRLLRLQRYSLRQQPSAMRDLWRDRRNPLQWYTFWAVFLVGGVSILLSVVQLFVGVGQLYFAIHPPNGNA